MFNRIFKNNKSVKVKMNAKQRLHTTICMLSLTIIALTTATYAWFTLSASTRVNELDLNVSAGANLKISTIDLGNKVEDYHDEVVSVNDGINDGTEIDAWLYEEYQVHLSDLLLSPQTSGNGVKLYTQQANEKGGSASKENASTYLQYELWFIAEQDMRVHLSTDEDSDGIYTHIASDSTNTAEQKDILSCVRMSFECEDDDRVVLWAPDGNNSDTTLKGKAMSDAGTSKPDMLSLNSLYAMEYTDDTYVCTLKANEQKKVTVRVWIEGEDPDCIDKVQKSKFITWLRFQGTDEDNNVIN
jgi:hypothetical protein